MNIPHMVVLKLLCVPSPFNILSLVIPININMNMLFSNKPAIHPPTQFNWGI